MCAYKKHVLAQLEVNTNNGLNIFTIHNFRKQVFKQYVSGLAT